MAVAHRYRSRALKPAIFAGQDAQILRRGAGSRNEYGEWDEAALDTIPITVSTVSGGRRREIGPGGQQIEADRTFYVVDPAVAIDSGTDDRDGDLIRWGGEHWRVIAVEDWRGLRAGFAVRTIPQDTALPVVGATPFERAVRAHIADGSGLPSERVIPANDHGPAPPGLHVSVLLASDRQVGDATEVYRRDGDDEVVDVYTDHEAEVHIQFWRAGALAAANVTVAWLDTPLAKEAEVRRDFRIRPGYEVRDLTAVLAGELEERVGLDLTISYRQSTRQIVEGIERVTLHAETEAATATGEADARSDPTV